MSNKPKSNQKPTDQLLQASYNAGLATGRLEAIEESMDAVAALIFKAETLMASLGENPNPVTQENARHTLKALYLAFAAVTGSVNGSNAFQDLLAQSKGRISKEAVMH